MTLRLLSLLLFLVVAVSAASPSTVTVYAWPLSASSPKRYAEIVLPSSAGGTAEVRSKTIPKITDGELVRIGLLDGSKAWSGVATSADSFKPGITQKISLHTDSDGQVTHIGFSSFKAAPAKEGAKSGDIVVEVVPIETGPQPVLNKPVVLNAEGKVDKPGQEDNRTFLQKYVYWPHVRILTLIMLQILVGHSAVPCAPTRGWRRQGVRDLRLHLHSRSLSELLKLHTLIR
jgi:hypothetical protein